MTVKIAPSVLSADFSNLGADVIKMYESGADLLHLDVMDGHFVPNISFGAPVIASIKKCTPIFFDVHLMISDPFKYLADFKKAGADNITFHAEAVDNAEEVIDKILELGCEASVSVKPNTPVEVVFPYLHKLNSVLIMSVEPGFGGQSFIHAVLPKVKALRREILRQGLSVSIQIDGGIDESTIVLAAANGADNFVSGSTIFKSSDPKATIKSLRKNAEEAYCSNL